MVWQAIGPGTRTRCCLIVLAGVWSGAKSIVLHTYKCSTSGAAVTYAAQPHAAQPDQQIHITFLLKLKLLLLLLSKKASIGWSCTVGNKGTPQKCCYTPPYAHSFLEFKFKLLY